MRWLMLSLALCAAGQTGPCTAEGVVLQEGNGAPVARARLLFRQSNGASPVALGYFTGDDGRFRAEGLNPGAYRVSLHKTGFLPPLAASRGRSAARLDFAANCRQTGLQYLLVPSAILSGRISDAAGQPAARVQVEAQRRAWIYGRWQFRAVSAGRTDDQGEFRIGRLPAGQYLLRAYPAGPMTVSFRDPAGPAHYLAPAYYPGVYEAGKARIISIDAGVEQGGFHFGPILVALFGVSGRVLSPEGDRPPPRCQVLLRDAQGGEERIARYTPETGEFSFPEVAPGRYQLVALAPGPMGGGSAFRELEITENDALGVELRLDPPFTVRGRVTLQGGTLPVGAVEVALLPASPGAAAPSPEPVAADGTFAIPAIARARYRLTIGSSQPNIYLRSISRGGVPQAGEWLDWSAGGAREIGLLLANDGGRLEGTASGLSGPAEDAFVVLVPADMARLTGSALLVGQGMLPEGRFRIAGIPPGDYLAYAFAAPAGDGVDYQAMLASPAWVPFYKGRPTPLRVEPNSLSRVALAALPLP